MIKISSITLLICISISLFSQHSNFENERQSLTLERTAASNPEQEQRERVEINTLDRVFLIKGDKLTDDERWKRREHIFNQQRNAIQKPAETPKSEALETE